MKERIKQSIIYYLVLTLSARCAVDRSRTATKCAQMKIKREKLAQLLFFIVKYANFRLSFRLIGHFSDDDGKNTNKEHNLSHDWMNEEKFHAARAARTLVHFFHEVCKTTA